MLRALLLLCLFNLLAVDSQAADPAKKGPEVVKVVAYPQPTPLEEKIRTELENRTEINFTDTPLSDAIDFLRDVHQVSILIDGAALQAEGIDPSSPVNLELSGISLRSALRLMLRPLLLTYVIEDEVLKITSKARASESIVTRVYPVPDLASDADELTSVVDAIKTGVAAASWETKGGRAAVTSVTKSRSLVIRQTQEAHEEIEALLKNLRDAEEHLKAFLQQQSAQHADNSRSS